MLKYSILTVSVFIVSACFKDDGTKVVLSEKTVGFEAETLQIRESDSIGSVSVDLSYASATAVQVSYKVEELRDGDGLGAIAGIDYNMVGSTNTVTIPAGSYTAPLQIEVVNNDVYETYSRQIKITITGVTGADGVTIASYKTVTVTIVNDDCPANTSVWYGNLYFVDDEGSDGVYDGTGTGAANTAGDCDILILNTDVFGLAGIYPLNFTPTELGATSGTVTLARQIAFTNANYSSYEIEGGDGGVYDEATKTITLPYTFYYKGSVSWTGVLTVTLN